VLDRWRAIRGAAGARHCVVWPRPICARIRPPGFTTRPPRPVGAIPTSHIGSGDVGTPVGFDTDVNGAALAKDAGARPRDSGFRYVTVEPASASAPSCALGVRHGHTELGNSRARKPATVSGRLPFHGDCIEGLASGPPSKRVPAAGFAAATRNPAGVSSRIPGAAHAHHAGPPRRRAFSLVAAS
jgi:fructokinase